MIKKQDLETSFVRTNNSFTGKAPSLRCDSICLLFSQLSISLNRIAKPELITTDDQSRNDVAESEFLSSPLNSGAAQYGCEREQRLYAANHAVPREPQRNDTHEYNLQRAGGAAARPARHEVLRRLRLLPRDGSMDD